MSKTNGWKKNEIQALKRENTVLKRELMKEQAERNYSQRVKIYCNKSLMLLPGQFKSFTVKVKIPLTEDEFYRRMRAAFPELPWEES